MQKTIMTQQEQRHAVVTEALSWQRTPHHNGVRLKGVGVDCGQFPLAVYEAVGLISPTKPERYSPQFHLHRDKEWYLNLCMQLGKELPKSTIPQMGDFVLYKVGRVFSHGAIVIEWPRIIHSYVNVGVSLDLGDQGWMAKNKDGTTRETKYFTLWG